MFLLLHTGYGYRQRGRYLTAGFQLEGLLKYGKIDRSDQFSQLIAIGADMVGNVTIEEIRP